MTAAPSLGDVPVAGADDAALAARTVLIVDDEPANVDLLESVLALDGFTTIASTLDAREAVPLFRTARPDIVLLDLHMPYRSGFEVLADLRATAPPEEYLPVLVLTADATFRAKQQALAGGANDFLTKPFNNAEVTLRVRNLLRTRLLYDAQRRARRAAELLDAASRVLHASLDGATAVTQLAELLVSDAGAGLADGCAVDLFDDEGTPVRAARAGDAAALDAADDGDRRAVALVAPLAAPGGQGPLGRLVLARAARDGAPAPPFDADERRLAVELARRAARAVENARLFRAARAATEARDQVLAVVAHDLRNPLTAVRMDAELLREKLDPAVLKPPQVRALARIDDTAKRMDALIQDLLDVARLGGGTMAVRLTEHAIGALFAEAADTLRPLAAAHDLEFDVHGSDDQVVAAVDGDRLLQVVSNLVGNAVKFTAAGGRVTLTYGVVDGSLRVSVADTGVGISAEQLPHVFGAFWQARHADRRGLGLGLAIARGIVEAHGGSIWVESAPGRGSTFVFSLPLGASCTLE